MKNTIYGDTKAQTDFEIVHEKFRQEGKQKATHIKKTKSTVTYYILKEVEYGKEKVTRPAYLTSFGSFDFHSGGLRKDEKIMGQLEEIKK